MKRILITGAAGFIGSSVADSLLKRGDRVIAVDNFDTHYSPSIKRDNIEQALNDSNYILFEADICDKNQIEAIFKNENPDVVVHLAACVGVRTSYENPALYYQGNVTGSWNILDACCTLGPPHLVFASSSFVYSDVEIPFTEGQTLESPISPYAITKRINELMAQLYSHKYDVNITILRIFTVYGPRQRPDRVIHKFARLIDKGTPVPVFGNGTAQRNYIYIDDCVEGIIKAIDTPFKYEIINLGGQSTTSLTELIELLSKHMGKPATVEHLPVHPGDVAISCANIQRAKDLLGYTPRFSMDEGIRRFVKWYNAQSLKCGKTEQFKGETSTKGGITCFK